MSWVPQAQSLGPGSVSQAGHTNIIKPPGFICNHFPIVYLEVFKAKLFHSFHHLLVT